MPSSSITLINKADANIVYNLVGAHAAGATFKDVDRSLALPRTLEFNYKIGQPGALGNDKLIITLKNALNDTVLGKTVVAQASLEVSVPRAAVVTATVIEDLLCQFASLLTDANAEKINDGVVP